MMMKKMKMKMKNAAPRSDRVGCQRRTPSPQPSSSSSSFLVMVKLLYSLLLLFVSPLNITIPTNHVVASARLAMMITMAEDVTAFAAPSSKKLKSGGGGGFGFASSSPSSSSSKKTAPGSDKDKKTSDDDTEQQHRQKNPGKIETIDMGRDKKVRLYVPRDELNQQLKNNRSNQLRGGRKNKQQKRSTKSPVMVDATTLLDDYYGTGDVIWPSSFALSRLLVHCPSLLQTTTTTTNDNDAQNQNQKKSNILELGCGLGLVSTSILTYRHENKVQHVTLTDRDPNVLDTAYASCVELALSNSSPTSPTSSSASSTTVSKCIMDWTDDTTWPKGVVMKNSNDPAISTADGVNDTTGPSSTSSPSSSAAASTVTSSQLQPYDILLASDVLYDKDLIVPLVNVICHYLLLNNDVIAKKVESDDDNGNEATTSYNDDNPTMTKRRAWIVDPINRINRDVFGDEIQRISNGLLEVETAPFPGMEEKFVLLSVTSATRNIS